MINTITNKICPKLSSAYDFTEYSLYSQTEKKTWAEAIWVKIRLPFLWIVSTLKSFTAALLVDFLVLNVHLSKMKFR